MAAPDFISDEDMARMAAPQASAQAMPDFIPDEHMPPEGASAPTESTGEYLSGLARAGVNGIFPSLENEAEGVSTAAMSIPYNAYQGVKSLFGGTPEYMNLGDAYNLGSDAAKQSLDQFKERHPYQGLIAEMAGALAPASKLAKLTPLGTSSLARRAGNAAIQGAVASGIAGFGEGSGTEDRLKNAVAGALIGAPLAGGLQYGGEKIGAFLTPLTQGGREKIAGDVIKEFSGDQDISKKIAAALASGGDFAPYQGAAELTGNPGLAQLETSLTKSRPDLGAAMTERGQARDDIRKAMIQALAPDLGMTPEEAGALVRGKIQEARGATSETVSDLFNSIDPQNETRISLDEARKAIGPSYEKYFGEFPGGGGTPSRETAALMRDLEVTPPTNKRDEINQALGEKLRPLQFIQNARSRALDEASMSTRGSEKALLGITSDELERAVETAAANGQISPEQAAKWENARDSFKDMKQTYDSGLVGQLLSNERGVYHTPDSLVTKRIVNPGEAAPERVRQVIKASGGDADVIDALRRSFIDTISDKSESGTTGQILNNKFNQFLDKHEGTLKEYFDPEHIANMRKVADDLQSQAANAARGTMNSRNQSYTTEGLSTVQFLKRLEGEPDRPSKIGSMARALLPVGGYAAAGPMGMAYAWGGDLMHEGLKGVAKANAGQVEQLLVDAIKDPQRMALLASKASPDTLSKILPYLGMELGAQVGQQTEGAL